MNSEKAIAILKASRDIAQVRKVYLKKIADAQATIDVKQKLIASYGTERVQGGKGASGLEDIIIKMERQISGYQQKLAEFEPITAKARQIIQCLPKRFWYLMNQYYIHATPVGDIAKAKGWCRATAYNQLYYAKQKLKEIFK